jgi:hypothetical protein
MIIFVFYLHKFLVMVPEAPLSNTRFEFGARRPAETFIKLKSGTV